MPVESANHINMLWKTRRALGLERKQVARLLGHRSTDLIARYENGNSLPNLKTILKLCIIYRVPVEKLFPEQAELFRSEIEIALSHMPRAFIVTGTRQALSENIHSCSYENLLEKRELTAETSSLIRRHITRLARQIAYL